MRGLQKCCLGQYFIFWLICWVLLSEMVLQCQVTAAPSNHAIKRRDMETASEVAKQTTVGHHVIGKPHINKSRHCGTKKTKSSGTKNGKQKKKTIARRASGMNNTKPSSSSSTEHPSLISPLSLPPSSSSLLPSPTKATTNPSVTTKTIDPSTTQNSPSTATDPSTTTDPSTNQDSPSTTTDPSTNQDSPSTTATTTTAPTALTAVANSPNEKNSVVQAIPGQTIQCDSGMPYVIASLIGFLAVFLSINGLLSWWSLKNKVRQQQVDEFQEYNVDHMMLP